MTVWIIDGGERWLSDTSTIGDAALEADLESAGEDHPHP